MKEGGRHIPHFLAVHFINIKFVGLAFPSSSNISSQGHTLSTLDSLKHYLVGGGWRGMEVDGWRGMDGGGWMEGDGWRGIGGKAYFKQSRSSAVPFTLHIDLRLSSIHIQSRVHTWKEDKQTNQRRRKHYDKTKQNKTRSSRDILQTVKISSDCTIAFHWHPSLCEYL